MTGLGMADADFLTAAAPEDGDLAITLRGALAATLSVAADRWLCHRSHVDPATTPGGPRARSVSHAWRRVCVQKRGMSAAGAIRRTTSD